MAAGPGDVTSAREVDDGADADADAEDGAGAGVGPGVAGCIDVFGSDVSTAASAPPWNADPGAAAAPGADAGPAPPPAPKKAGWEPWPGGAGV